MADTVNTNQFKNGMHIEVDGQPWRIVEFQHVKPGKGGAFVRTKLKSLDAGAIVDRTFRAGEKFPRVHTEVKNVQYLYDDGSDVHFMDPDTYEQFSVPHAELEDELMFMQPNATVQVLAVNGKPSSVQLPMTVELTVVDTEPGVKGDTVSNVTKPATLETGGVVERAAFRERRRQAQDRPAREALHQPRLAWRVRCFPGPCGCLLAAAVAATVGGDALSRPWSKPRRHDGDPLDRVRLLDRRRAGACGDGRGGEQATRALVRPAVHRGLALPRGVGGADRDRRRGRDVLGSANGSAAIFRRAARSCPPCRRSPIRLSGPTEAPGGG